MAPVLLCLACLPASEVEARDLNAEFIINEMNTDQRVSYIAGVIEGLAFSRFLRDRPDQTGMKCIYDWYYTRESVVKQVDQWFRRHPDKFAGVLLHTLVKRECGE